MTHTTETSILATDEYAQLLLMYRPRSIRDDAEAEIVQAEIDALVDKSATEPLSEAEEELLSLLGDIMFTWHDGNENLPQLPPHEMVKALMDVNNYKQVDLVGPIFPTQSVASAVLAGKRKMTYDFVERLSEFFGVSPELFFPSGDENIGPYALNRRVRGAGE